MEATDLKIIQQLFFKNESSADLNPDLISFNKKVDSDTATKFYYINNLDGTIRWIYPAKNESPVFLSLYNNAGWKATLYKAIIKICFQLGIKSMFTNGYFTIQNRSNPISQYFPKTYYDDYAIFTGTVGENRKAIVAVAANKYAHSFVKIPLTKKAKALVENESAQLQYVQKLELVKMATPKCSGSEGHLILSNITPVSTLTQSGLTDFHLSAVEEYYRKTVSNSLPQNISLWSEIRSNVDFLNNEFEIQNDLDGGKINRSTKNLNLLFNWMETAGAFPVGLAHGDFTPWNMYLSKEQIRVYDWEMSRSDMPLLFDIFHFVFQNQILIKQGSYETIIEELKSVEQNPILQNIITDHNIDWSLHYAFYLVYISSYYLPLYVEQKELHMQAHWLVNVWDEALNAISKNILNQELVEI